MTKTPDRTFQAAARSALLAEIDQRRPEGAGGRTTARRSGREVLRIALVTGILGATVAAAWFGITVAQQHTRAGLHVADSATTRPSVAPSVAPTETPDPVAAAIGSVVGTGRLTGAITGDFTIRYHAFVPQHPVPYLTLTNLHVGTSTARQVLLSVDLASATCKANNSGFLAGTITAARTQTVDLQDSGVQTVSDLSYLHAIAIWKQEGCAPGDVAASGTITWKLPAAIRDLARTDHGTRPGATGPTSTIDGRPSRYTVEPDDQITAVAARFDLTVADLLYLNPLRRRGNDTTLYAGEQLNLNPLTRDWFWR